MATDDEEYYDSIEDSEFEECRSFCNDKFREEDSELDEDLSSKFNELVPFYMGNIDKSEIGSLKNESKTNSIITLRSNKLKRRPPQVSIIDQRKNRSYLTMFYARIEQSVKFGGLDSNRATCSELSPKSPKSLFINENEDSSYFGNEGSEGLYSRFMENEDGEVPDEKQTSVLYKCESETTIRSKLLSVSEAHFSSCVSSRQEAKRDMPKGRITYRKAHSLRLGELGGLGPNIAQEKIESLRRRQDYGKTVSEKNRIKFLETKVLRKLKQEIFKSNQF